MTTDTTNSDYTAPLSTLISRITARLAPPAEKTVIPIAVPTPTVEILSELLAGHLTSAHLGKTISLGDGIRGKIVRIDRRFEPQSGRERTDVTTAQGGLRTYGSDCVLLLVELRPRPVPSAVRTPAQLEHDTFRTAEYAAEEATRLSLIPPTQQPRVLRGYFAGLTV